MVQEEQRTYLALHLVFGFYFVRWRNGDAKFRSEPSPLCPSEEREWRGAGGLSLAVKILQDDDQLAFRLRPWDQSADSTEAELKLYIQKIVVETK